MDDVTALRDALLAKLTSDWDLDPYGEHEAAVMRLRADLDTLIAAVEARAALTPERLAKALAVALRGDPTPGYRHTPRTDRQYEALAGRVLAALATDEAVPWSGWRHVDDCGTPDDDPFCGCTTPTPGPTSPCGQLVSDGFGRAFQCGGRDSTGHAHPHVPTRCTCGHAIEAVP